MDTKDGKIFQKEPPELLKKRLRQMSSKEMQKLLEILEDPEKNRCFNRRVEDILSHLMIVLVNLCLLSLLSVCFDEICFFSC